jgi:hypothetical protein
VGGAQGCYFLFAAGATCAHTPNSHQSDWQEHGMIPRRAHQPRRSVSEDRRKMLVPSALIAAPAPGKYRLAKYCSDGYGFMDTALEQNHDNRAQKGFVQGIDFLRKSILCGFGLGYIYRDFAIKQKPSS